VSSTALDRVQAVVLKPLELKGAHMDSNNIWTRSELLLLKRHATPDRAQRLLDSLPYRCESGHFSALSALREGHAHCFDGSLLAAAALMRGEHTPLLIDLCAEKDDDHVICAYRWKGHWGAVAKSNFPGLRFREPIYRNPRELVLSYFELYFSMKRFKSLRRFSKPMQLPSVSRINWECDDAAADHLVTLLTARPHYELLGGAQKRVLRPVDQRLYQSQLLGVNRKGVY
jgi:hypothetical protein